MPIKYNLTKYDVLSSKVKKLSTKKNGDPFTKEDRMTVIKAILIASFASGHSWKTFKAATAPAAMVFNNPEIKKEYEDAATNKWKSISNFDIAEVSSANIPDSAFFEWLVFNVNKADHDEYKTSWWALKQGFDEDCDLESNGSD